MDAILVVNAGSSSLKLQMFEAAPAGMLRRLVEARIEGVGTAPRFHAVAGDGAALIDRALPPEAVPDLPAALHVAEDWLRGQAGVTLAAVGHRVVHGGPAYDRPIVVTPAVLADLERLVPLAPLHQPHNLAPIRTLMARRPDLPQVACFDTAFHRGRDPLADRFAIPQALHDEGIRRYGFHGLSYEYVTSRLPEVAPEIAGGRVIVAHLGSGASLCALAAGRSVETTMGFTGLDGLPMGTRPGRLDPGVLLHLMAAKGMDAGALEHFLYRDCGLKGLSGIGSDMRDLEASDDPRAAFAIGVFVYRIGLEAGMLAAALGGLDGVVFTAGIGENSARLRAAVAERLAWLGAVLDPVANAQGRSRISAADSRVALLVVPTNEELMVARHTAALVVGSSSVSRGPA
ncbi:acetate/propionate family kinase [Rhodoplanes sp. TEM]|uniref:Acetate kinase n=1 Tax=Rhodoplanes tepidamans TaxID=200616 RepID=A0ABT5JCV8_RHOTP|nr:MULTISPECIES: acetate/propionate family kinase [Rhodoplanes]MDC7787501.1 acetate/propionate family kinase [Rhodoplanes tepidamans]MDC7983908.1 acetate/propionate family kinase [Rhodoplanes sp. TEM]MDQ0354347.1 acetate kinase [Rhodoplanes tepidamans]